jgi:hypothetical protein
VILKQLRSSPSGVKENADTLIQHLRFLRQIRRKRVVLLSITHKLSTEKEAELDISQARETSPDDHVAWRGSWVRAR